MRPAKPFGQGGELWEASDQGNTPVGGVDQWPGATTADPSGVPGEIPWNAPDASSQYAQGDVPYDRQAMLSKIDMDREQRLNQNMSLSHQPSFAPGEWDQVPGGPGQDPKDGGGFVDFTPQVAGMVPEAGGGFQYDDPAQQFQDYQDAMTVPVGEDPLSQNTNQTLQNLVTSGQGEMGNQAQGVLGTLLGNMGELDDPYNPYAHKARPGIAGMIDEEGGSADAPNSAWRTGLGGQVQGQLGTTIAQGGELPAHQMVQQAQTQLTDLMAQGQTRQLSPSEQAMVQQLEQTIQTGGQLAQSGLAQTSEQALQNIIQQGGMPQQSEGGAQTSQQISDLLANQGRLPEDLQREAMQIEAARSPLDVMRRAQTAQGAAALADRGLVGSGGGREYLEGLEGRLAPQYTQAAQQIEEQRRQADDQRYSQALGLGAQRGGQLESLQQQGMQSALGQAGQQTAQQEQLEQSERQQAMGQAGQYGLGLGQQGQQQQQFGISQATELGTQQDQMRDARYSQAIEQAGQMNAQEVEQRQERYLQSVMAGEGIGRDEAMRRDQRLQSSIQQATGLDGQRIQNLLATAQTVGERQELIGGMAMDALENNQNWNRFMAEHGLNRQAVMEGLRQGRAGIVMNMMELYQRSVAGIHGGYQEYDISS